LLHELEADTARGVDEGNPASAERSGHDLRSPHDRVPLELAFEIVGEEGRMKESLGR